MYSCCITSRSPRQPRKSQYHLSSPSVHHHHQSVDNHHDDDDGQEQGGGVGEEVTLPFYFVV
eukprot:scaffold40475_cov47-Attheya_sp.AAC.4